MRKGIALRLFAGFLYLGMVLVAPPLMAFEGDYIWEDRFKAQLAKANEGAAEDEYTLAEMYLWGRGTPINEKEALSWFIRAARQDNTKAAYRAGYLYLHAKSFHQSVENALPWLIKASNTGFPAAQYELGLLYANGRGVTQDKTTALAFLAKSKLAGYEPAKQAFNHIVQGLMNQISVSMPPKIEKPKPARNSNIRKASLRPELVTHQNPKRMILGSIWRGRNGPSTLLPSKLTDCRDLDGYIECLSSRLTRQVASNEVVYRTRARISQIQDDGSFRLEYTNQVLSATNEEGKRAMDIKTGWQANEHTLDCSLGAGQTIECSKSALETIRFTAQNER